MTETVDYELSCPCAYCGAKPGERCRTLTSRMPTQYHADRMRQGTVLYFREHPERRRQQFR